MAEENVPPPGPLVGKWMRLKGGVVYPGDALEWIGEFCEVVHPPGGQPEGVAPGDRGIFFTHEGPDAPRSLVVRFNEVTFCCSVMDVRKVLQAEELRGVVMTASDQDVSAFHRELLVRLTNGAESALYRGWRRDPVWVRMGVPSATRFFCGATRA